MSQFFQCPDCNCSRPLKGSKTERTGERKQRVCDGCSKRRRPVFSRPSKAIENKGSP